MTSDITWRPSPLLTAASLLFGAAVVVFAVYVLADPRKTSDVLWGIVFIPFGATILLFVFRARISISGSRLLVRGPFRSTQMGLAEVKSCTASDGAIRIEHPGGELVSQVAQRIPMWKRETRGDRICAVIMKRAEEARTA